MIAERNYRSHFPFTASQWQELEQQVLTFRYLMSGIPVPPGLMSTVMTTPSKSSSSTLFPQQPTLPFGLGCFQVGYGRKIDPEPGRCRRTDGKKWRCSKEAHPDSKYCEKHMHRTKAKAKKQFDVYNNNSSTKSPTNHSTSSSSPYKSCLPYPPISASSSLSHSNINLTYANKTPTNHTTNYYPFMSGQSSSLSNVSLSTQDNGNGSQWLDLDGDFHAQPVKKDIRHCDEIKGVVDEMTWGSKASKINATCSSRYENYRSHDEERSLGVDKEHESQKLFHHFLGDWPMKLKSSQSQAVGVLSRSK